MQVSRKISRLKLAGLIVGTLFALFFMAAGIWWVSALNNPERLAAFRAVIESLGVGGWFALLGIQYTQVTLAFIPGGPIQIVAGALYGPWGGFATCMLGTVLGGATIFALVRRFGRKVIGMFVDEGDILKYKFLSDAKKLSLLVLLLFFIPGTPKDALTYLFALTRIEWRRFILLSTAARIPGMLISTFAGDSIMHGEWVKAGALFGVISVVTIAGVFIHGKIKHK